MPPKKSASDSNSKDNDEDQKLNKYYSGGEQSGLMTQAAATPDNSKANQELIDSILKIAQENPSAPALQAAAGPSSQPPLWSGRGFMLGDGESPSSSSAQPVVSTQQPAAQDEHELVERRLTFWKNGFTIDNDANNLYDYNDPKCQAFLKQLKAGMANLQFLNLKHGQEVEMKIEHRANEDFTPQIVEKKIEKFSGQGNRLGAPTTAFTTSPMIPGSFPSAGTPAVQVAVESITKPSYSIDESQPTTSLQIRLADGTRMVARFNHSHTVADIRQFVSMSRPGESARNFVLMTTFPNRELADPSLTLKDANLLNAAIIQKIT